ncbi:MAG: hypothetical protein ABW133_15930 [Polyangiaceae bacterium]
MNRATAVHDVCLTGLGMTTSLGQDAVTSCAAARARMVRPSTVETFKLGDPENMEGTPVKVHAALDVTRGFEGDARLLRLLVSALGDLWSGCEPGSLGDSPRFYLSLPHPRRVYSGLPRLEDDDRADLEAEIRALGAAVDPRIWAEKLLGRALGLSECAVLDKKHIDHPVIGGVTFSGTSGTLELLAQVATDLQAREVSAAIVIGADSLLDTSTLEWLERTARLKTPNRPAGLMPGEGAACLLFERRDQARRRRARELGTLAALSYGNEPSPLLSGGHASGHALAETIVGVEQAAAWREPSHVWLITDQNGEIDRAEEWGATMTHLVSRSPIYVAPQVWYPAITFGDTGAAYGAVAMGIAARAFQRKYAPFQNAVIASSSEGATRSMAVLQRPEEGMSS